MSNRKFHANNSSGYRGVQLCYRNKDGGETYLAVVKSKGNVFYLGTFKCKIEAYKAVLKKNYDLYGEGMPSQMVKDFNHYFIGEQNV